MSVSLSRSATVLVNPESWRMRGDRLTDTCSGLPSSAQRAAAWRDDRSTRAVSSYRYTYYPLLAPRVQLLRLRHMAASKSSDGAGAMQLHKSAE